MSRLGQGLQVELKGDRAIWLIAIFLGITSLLAVYSSTGTIAFQEKGGNTEFYLFKHFVILMAGFGLMYILYTIHYMQFSKWAPVFLLITIPLLLYTLVMGSDYNEARRWITLPIIDLTFQTSDFAKLALIIYLARVISSKQEYIEDFKSAFIPIIVPVITVCALIAPADLSTAALLFLTCFVMMFVGRVHWKYLIMLLILGTMVFSILIILGQFFPEWIRVDTWTSRMNEFMTNAEGGYQVQQAKIAIANGEWFGTGPGNGFQRNYLPSPYADFIYAIILEEYGLFGGFVILGLYVWLFFRTTSLVTKSPKAFGAILAIGLCLSLVLQAFVNIAVSVHLVPVTGITLPLVSMGGTSILFACAMIGIIQSVSRYIERIDEKVKLQEELTA